MFKNSYVILFILILLPTLCFSQFDMGKKPGDEEEKPDVKKVNIKSQIKVWELDGYGIFTKYFEIDTLLDKVHIFHPIYKNAITNAYTGNYGGPYLDNDFFSRDYNTDFLFLQTHDAYLLTPKNIKYYNTTTPYTLLDYSQSENKSTNNETRFNVLHTQNITPDLNITFRFDQARSDGQYDEQENKNNFISLYANYQSDKLRLNGGFISNRIGNDENGGLKDDSQIFDEYKVFNLIDARSEYRSSYFYTTTEYRLGNYSDTIPAEPPEKPGNVEGLEPGNIEDLKIFKPHFSVIHYFEYSNNLRQFTESEDEVNHDFYPETLIDSSFTNDSVRYRKLTNVLQVMQYEDSDKKYSFGKRVFLGVDIAKISYPGYTKDEERYVDRYHDLYIGGGIFRETGKFWNWNINAQLNLTGYHSGQTRISGVIYKPFSIFKDTTGMLEINGRLENRVPDIFQKKYNSNHYSWYNKFNHEQRMTAGVKLKSEIRRLEAGVNYSLINNYIYNDTIGEPVQAKKELLILSAYINNHFILGNFNVKTKLLAQKASSNDYIHIPDFSAFVGIYYQFIVSKVLYAQIGIDTRYHTKYYADAYNPATGWFHLQDEKKIGNYPYIDAYANLRLKRTRVFFKLINVGTSFIDREYFTALHHPMNKMTFRLGVDWRFYD